MDVTVEAGATVTADAALEAVTISLSEIVVEGASRAPERIVEAPAAISVVPPEVLQNVSITGQAPLALQAVPGVDVVQSGVNDFNVNARGFNSSLNRRVLVLQDGRDLAIAFLGSQEWNGMTQPLEDLGKVEMVRGPGSALYGANAFSGVVNITTPDRPRGDRHQAHAWRAASSRPSGATCATRASSPDDRFGLRVNAGYNRSDTYTRTRTRLDGTSLQREYAEATDEPVGLVREVRPLDGQTRRSRHRRRASATATRCVNGYGSARLDYYLDNGSVLTVDGGAVAGPERDLRDRHRPGAGGPRRSSPTPGWRWPPTGTTCSPTGTAGPRSTRSSRSSPGLPIEERSDIFHVEGQTNWNFQEERGRVVVGASVRNTQGQHQRHADEPGQRRPERRPLLGLRPGRVQADPAAPRWSGARRLDDGDLIDAPVLAQGRAGLQPQREPLVPLLGQPGVPDAELLRVLPPGAGGGADAPGPRTLEGGIEQLLRRGSRPACRRRRSPASTITDNLPWNFSAADPGARAGQRGPRGREGHRLGAGLQGQPVEQGLRHG